MYCSFLEEQNNAKNDKATMNDAYNESLFLQKTTGFQPTCAHKDIDMETDMRMKGFNSKLMCDAKKNTTTSTEHCAGYDCMRPETFLVQPDKFNTSHNYNVLQEEQIHGKDVYCTNNHQYFQNFTRRHHGVINNSQSHGGLPPDVDKIPELKYNICDIYPKPVEMKCSFP